MLERYQKLIEISRDLNSTLDLDVLLHSIVGAAAQVTESMAASILLYDESKNELYFQASTHLDTPLMVGLSVPVEGSIAGEIVTKRKPIIMMKAQNDPRHFQEVGESTQFITESLLGVPLITKNRVIGVLEALNKHDGDFNENDQELLTALGAQAAVAIQNSRLFQQSDLIAEMVHELRTPLASIGTATHLLMRAEISEEQRTKMAKTIQNETNRLSDMTTSFLDLAILESGRGQFKIEEVDVRSILKETAEIMQNRISEQGLTLELEIANNLPKVQGDRNKFKQVTLNFLSNAIKYNRPNGKITMGAKLDGDNLSIFVTDTGRGMLAEHVDSLFEKFFRVPGSEEFAKGTGLGLSICKKIIEGHGGEIVVTSEFGKGTTFSAIIPIVA